ncbi:family 10 glycosylhydrolase [bacterium]|nr:family 10 glycosylhydrolase [bacterium]
MTLLLLFFLAISFNTALPNASLVVDSCDYKSENEARQIWVAQGKSTAVSIKKEKERNYIALNLNFADVDERCYWDRDLNLDLSDYEKFVLKLWVEDPSKLGHCTLYFRSAGGWFGHNFTIEKSGWQEITLKKSQFSIEDSPVGWNQITGMRLSFWKPSKPVEETQVVLLGGIIAIPSLSKIGILFSDTTIKAKSPEANTVQRCFDDITGILDSYGIDYKVVNDSWLEEGGEIRDCNVLILPYNPNISAKVMDALEKFVDKGGKLIVFYTLNQRLAEILGILDFSWQRAGEEGKFSSVRFNQEIVDGLPERMYQGSWNANIPRKFSEDVRIIGEWVDAFGFPTGLPAATISGNGFYFGHILLNQKEGKQMVLSVLSTLSPQLKPMILNAVKERSGRFLDADNFNEVKNLINGKIENIEPYKRELVLGYLLWAEKDYKKLEKAENLGEIFRLADKMKEYLLEAYSRVFPSKPDEFRAVWCHSAFGIEGWSWEDAIKFLKEHNFNAIIVNMLWAGLAYYHSEVLPVADEVRAKGDQIAQCLSACKKYGIECHIWKVNWNLANAPKEFVERLRREGRLQMDRFGKEVLWLCPSHPENFKLELESMLEVVRKYDIDGIHFDYIRYPDANSCYCPACKARFEKEKGVLVSNWPEDVISGQYKQLYADWRREQITRLVKAVSEEAKKLKPSLKISAAVFADYPSCRESVGQDWKLWIDNGYLDFVCPMDYTDSEVRFRTLAENQRDIVAGRIPLYTGIGAFIIPVEKLLTQIELSREVGADGFVLFNYDKTLLDKLPYLLKGITSEPSEPAK